MDTGDDDDFSGTFEKMKRTIRDEVYKDKKR